jgi:hypothetical protein
MLTVNWVAQTFLQLVLLSIIIVGQRVLSEADDARADADHETLDLLHQMNILQLKILRELEKGAEAEAEAASKLKSKTTSTNRNR